MICDGSLPSTRLIDVLAASGWLKRVVLPCGTEKDRQSMAEWRVPAPFTVVIVSWLPCLAKAACPWTTVAPLACASAATGTLASAAVMASSLKPGLFEI